MYSISKEISSSFKFWEGIQAEIMNRKFLSEHPEYFEPQGIVVFCGGQGQGKTLSAVRYIVDLMVKYPQCVCISNTNITSSLINPIRFIPYEGVEFIDNYDNGYAGIILFLDEIQTEFNSLESKNIDPSIFQVISQQRKRRLHVVGTSQLYSRIAKPWREQMTSVVNCKNILRRFQLNAIEDYDGVSEDEDGRIEPASRHFYFFFHRPSDYDLYNTFEKVKKVEEHSFLRKRKV